MVKAYTRLADYSVDALASAGWDTAVLDARWPEWQRIVDTVALPVVAEVFTTAYQDTADRVLTAAAGDPISPVAAASRHLATVRNRMVGTSDAVFDLLRSSLDEGRVAGEDIPTLANRVEKTLRQEGTATWRGRGTTVARTEVIAANNAGSQSAAYDVADTLGHGHGDVCKEWGATLDDRVRPTHSDADGQKVIGLDTQFTVGSSMLVYPGDPAGPAEEVVNCRCTVFYWYPGDPEYPTDVIPPATLPPTTGGNLTPEQYETLAPQTQWSVEQQNLIKSTLSSSPEGKALHDVLDRFQDGGSIARLRTNITKRLAGETIPAATEQKVDALLDAIRHAPGTGTPDTLYRGMTVPGTLDNVLAKYTAGDAIDLSLASFSADRKIGVKFQQMTMKSGRNQTRVMVELEGSDAKALPIQNLARDRRLFKEKEWVTNGRFRITEVKKSPSGGIIVRLKQEVTL